MESNLQLPYHIVQTNDLTYKFIALSGVVYTAYFIDISESFGADSVYTFSFDAAGKTVKDERVRCTIVKILSDFFQLQQNSLIVVCETADHKEKARFKLFQKWYELTNGHRIEKVDIALDQDDYNLRSSLLIPEDHPHNHEIKDIYCGWAKSSTDK